MESYNFQRPFVVNSTYTSKHIQPCHDWDVDKLIGFLGDKHISCRVLTKSCDRIMETDCIHLQITLENFKEWLNDTPTNLNPLHNFPRSEFSCYIDYKYIKDVFEDQPERYNDVKWDVFGLHEFNGYDSTLWIGSEGANTPCHQDSYGFNLVTQIMGRKVWVLFPPENTSCMYPTRVPYEESSVFSAVNVRKPNTTIHPKFMHSKPVILTLHPGQTLYVPRHWWHYVYSLDTSVSVNFWVPHHKDVESRLHEAITRTLASTLIEDMVSTRIEGEARDKDRQLDYNNCLNPTETLSETTTNIMLLKTSLDQLQRLQQGQGTQLIQDQTVQGANIDVSDTKDAGPDGSLGDKVYLQRFSASVKDIHVSQVSSPFTQQHLLNKVPTKRKRSDQSLQGDAVKRFKLSQCADRPVGPEQRNVLLEESVDTSHCEDKRELDEGRDTLFSVSSCSAEDLIKFMDNLCQQTKCCSCVASNDQILHKDNLNKVNKNSHRELSLDHLHRNDIEPESSISNTYQESGNSSVSLCLDTKQNDDYILNHIDKTSIMYHDGFAQDYTRDRCIAHNKIQNKESRNSSSKSQQSEGIILSTNSLNRGCGNDPVPVSEIHTTDQTKDNALGDTEEPVDNKNCYSPIYHSSDTRQLTDKEIAEALLSSVLHPDVISLISLKLREKCETLLKEKK